MGFGNEVGEEAERIKHGVAVVSLGRVLKDAHELVGRQAKESLRLSVKFRPDLVTSHHNGFIFVRQPLGPLLNGVAIRCASLCVGSG